MKSGRTIFSQLRMNATGAYTSLGGRVTAGCHSFGSVDKSFAKLFEVATERLRVCFATEHARVFATGSKSLGAAFGPRRLSSQTTRCNHRALTRTSGAGWGSQAVPEHLAFLEGCYDVT